MAGTISASIILDTTGFQIELKKISNQMKQTFQTAFQSIASTMKQSMDEMINDSGRMLETTTVYVESLSSSYSNLFATIQSGWEQSLKAFQDYCTLTNSNTSGEDKKESSSGSIKSVMGELKEISGYYETLKKVKKDTYELMNSIIQCFQNGPITSLMVAFLDIPGMQKLAEAFIKSGGFTGIAVKFLDLPGMQGMVEGIVTIFRTLPAKLTEVVSGFTSLFDFSSIFQASLNGISAFFSNLGSFFSTGLEGIKVLLLPFKEMMTGLFTSFLQLPGIGPALEGFFGLISGLIETVSPYISGLLSGISNILTTIVSSPALLASVVAAVIAALVQLWNSSDEFRNNIVTAWNHILEVIFSVWTNVLEPIFNAFKNILIDVWINGIQPLWNEFTKFVGVIVQYAQVLWDGISSVITSVWNLWVEFIGTITNLITGMWNCIAPILTAFLDFIGPKFSAAFDFLSKIVSTVINVVISKVTVAINKITNIMEGLLSSVSHIVDGIKNFFQGICDFLGGIFTGDISRITNGLVQMVGGILEGIIGVASAPINGIIGLINSAIDGLNSIHVEIPDFIPIIGGESFGVNIEKIPYLARGGIVAQPTLAMVGERGKEAIMPLENNTGWIDQLAQRIATQTTSNHDEVYLLQQILDRLHTLDLRVDLDGEVIYRNQEKLRSRKGLKFSNI